MPTEETKRELEAARVFVEANPTDKDKDDDKDPFMVAEYIDDIIKYMRSLEKRMKPNASYMDKQPYLKWTMRKELLGWLIEVHDELCPLPEILFLAVNCFDRYLSCTEVHFKELQLFGATALFIASKYESRYLLYEKHSLSKQDFVDVANGAYTVKDLLKAERLILRKLEFNLEWPGPMSFLRRISRADNYDSKTRDLSKYVLEITIMDERFVGCVPSFLSAGSYCLARFMLKKRGWVFLCPLHCW
jgi:G2/mitotic-specific cyclin 3/4